MFTLQIETDNAAFNGCDGRASYECARILRALAGKLEDQTGNASGFVRDVNGNKCGSWALVTHGDET